MLPDKSLNSKNFKGEDDIYSPDLVCNFESTFTSVLGHEVHALVGGGGGEVTQSMVMIHGALASRRYLMPTACLLSKSMKVFVPEMPGHGESSKPPHALSVEQQAKVIFEWLQLNELQRIHIFANSYGCQIAAELAATHPEIVHTLTLTGAVDPEVWVVEQAYRLYMDGFSEPRSAQAQLFADLADMGIPLALETVQAMIDNDIRTNAAKLNCRTLVIRGENDPLAPQVWTEELARRIANSKMFVIPSGPHCVNYATPEELTSIMLRFMHQPTPDLRCH
jgi:2-hydroxy-6-oxonona-2,4-dienedioate hydrolase